MHWKVLLLTLSCLLMLRSITSNAVTDSNLRFALKISTTLGLEHVRENVVVAPLLLQSALVLLYAGASEDTAPTLRSALELQSYGTPNLALNAFQTLLSNTKQLVAQHARANMISALYAQERYTFNFKPEFIATAERLGLMTERLDFDNPTKALDHINYAFLTRTNYTIGEVLTAQSLQADTPFLLLSAAVFQAPWAKGFDVGDIRKLNFHSDLSQHKLIDFMFLAHKFKYAEYKDFDAKAIELPFENLNLKMLIFMPNKIEGLATLEHKLKFENLAALLREMKEQKITLSIPKFRIEHRSDLKKVLTQLGLASLFADSLKFSNIFSTLLPSSMPQLTAVPHKSLLEINEMGGDADSGFSFGDLFRRSTQLIINRPFYYIIRTEDAVLLAGHVVNI